MSAVTGCATKAIRLADAGCRASRLPPNHMLWSVVMSSLVGIGIDELRGSGQHLARTQAGANRMIGDLGARDATELAGLVAAGEVTANELLDAALAAVDARNPAINAVVLVQEAVARKSIADGLPRGPFRGAGRG